MLLLRATSFFDESGRVERAEVFFFHFFFFFFFFFFFIFFFFSLCF